MEGVETLSLTECFGLLAGRSLARVAYTERALPAAWPVHYVLVDRRLVLRDDHDGLHARLDGQIVAVQIDDADADGKYSWVVVVTGTARLLGEPAEPGRQREVTAVEITPGDVRGHRVRRTPATAA